jgi:hypothetical protein
VSRRGEFYWAPGREAGRVEQGRVEGKEKEEREQEEED